MEAVWLLWSLPLRGLPVREGHVVGAAGESLALFLTGIDDNDALGCRSSPWRRCYLVQATGWAMVATLRHVLLVGIAPVV